MEGGGKLITWREMPELAASEMMAIILDPFIKASFSDMLTRATVTSSSLARRTICTRPSAS